MTTKLHIAPVHPGERVLDFIDFVRGGRTARTGDNTLFNKRLADDFAITAVEFVDDPAEADYLLVPHGISRQPDALMQAYLDSVRAIAAQHQKEIIVFIGGDLSHDIFIDDMIVLKGSQYRYLKRDNEIIVPIFVEELGRQPLVREKREVPIVGFCGWAGFPSLKARVKYEILNAICDVKALLGHPYARAHKKGLWFRRKAMRALEEVKEIETRFIVRMSFSGNRKTIALDPEAARKEYLDNMEESHFMLAPKGEGNFSVRFLEAMALGCIPVLIDTECCLPFEDIIPYDELIVRVPWQETARAAEYVLNRWGKLTSEEYHRLQDQLRSTFRTHLRYDAFFNRLFSEVLTPERARRTLSRGQAAVRG